MSEWERTLEAQESILFLQKGKLESREGKGLPKATEWSQSELMAKPHLEARCSDHPSQVSISLHQVGSSSLGYVVLYIAKDPQTIPAHCCLWIGGKSHFQSKTQTYPDNCYSLEFYCLEILERSRMISGKDVSNAWTEGASHLGDYSLIRK